MFKSLHNIYSELATLKFLFQELVREAHNTSTALMQIYGEVNRIRLIQAGVNEKDKARIATKIQEFDHKVNFYIPFFDSKKGYDNYQAAKVDKGKPVSHK